MEKNARFRALSTSIIIFIVACNFLFTDGIRWSKYQVDSSFNGFRCIPSLTVFETHDASDATVCGKRCHNDDKCVSFFYRKLDHKCVGCMVDLLGPAHQNNYDKLNGSIYYRIYGADCIDIIKNSKTGVPSNGIYEVKPRKSRSKIKVLCDFETGRGGWTVFQNRFDGSVDFNRNFRDYENGFGDAPGEYWLGLKYIQEMLEAGMSEILIQATAKNGETALESANGFKLENENEYRIELFHTNTQGMSSDCLSGTNSAPFTAKDKDMDFSEGNCAAQMHGAWWYKSCESVDCNLNGIYGKNGKTGFYLRGISGYESLNASKMMFRRFS